MLTATALVIAHPQYATNIPNGNAVRDCQGEPWAGVGHLRSAGGGPRNSFGEDFRASGYTWTRELCEKDSDADGKTNGLELGDPSCTWSPGKSPQFDTGITHPGIDCSCSDSGAAPIAPPATGCDVYSGNATDHVDLTFAGHPVGPGTSYIKGAFTWPGSVSAGVLRFEFMNHNPQVVHHMLLYRCPQDVSDLYTPPTEGSSMGCTDVLMAWAVGGGPFCAPRGLAFVVEPGSPYFMLEIHYDNPTGLTGIVDTSGMRLHFVPFAGSGLGLANTIIAGAQLPRISIPPQRSSYRATVNIPVNLPDNFPGVDSFAVIEHMHGIGRKQWLTLVDDDAGDAEEMTCNTAYDFDIQEAKYLPTPVRIERGQRLVLDCVYDSTGRTAITHGGDATQDEMCIIILFYSGPSTTASLLSSDVQLDSGSGDKTCGCSAASPPVEAGYDYERGKRMLALHAWLMIPAWALLLPAGALVPRFWSAALGKRWLYLHLSLVLPGLVLAAVGLYAAVDATNALQLSHFDASAAKGHKVVGLGIVVICSLQLIGLARPHKPAASERPSRARLLWSWSHRIGGLTALVLALAQAVTGAEELANYMEIASVGGVDFPVALHSGMLLASGAFGALGWLLGSVLLRRRGRVTPQTSPEKPSKVVQGRSDPTVVAVAVKDRQRYSGEL